MDHKCLICDEAFPESSTTNAGSKKSRTGSGTDNILISDQKTRFALTNSQYVILKNVLSLPEGICKTELTNGPYCRDCFTHINNVCHIMSALENLQESIQEFRKDFGAKLKASFDAAGASGHGTRGKRKNPAMSFSGGDGNYAGTRQTILDYLKSSLRFTSQPTYTGDSSSNSKPKHLHEIIKKMDPGNSPNTKVTADMVVRTTNGDMPMSSISRRSTGRSVALNKGQQSVGKSTAANTEQSASKKWTGQKKYPCLNCKLRFYKESSLKDHVKKHHAELGGEGESDVKEYVCWYCKASFDNDEELQEHEEEHKASKVCPICQKQFTRTNTLNRHILTHANKKAKKEKKCLKCDSCSKTFYSKKVLKNHKAKEHRREKHTVKLSVSSSNNNSTKRTFRPGRCKICSRIVTDLEGHMQSTHPGEKINASSSTKINENGNSSDVSVTSAISNVKVLTKIRAGPASWKLKANLNHPAVKKETSPSPPPPVLIAEGMLTTSDNLDYVRSSIDSGRKSDRNLNVNEENKTEENANDDKNSLPTLSASEPILEPKHRENNFLSAATKMALPLSPPQEASSKYQFKNLLKIGDI